MTKKDLEDIIQTAKAAGADVKIVQIGSTEKETGTDERPAVPLLKLELSIKKDGDALSVLADADWNILGSLFLEMAPINIDIEKVKEMFTPAKNAFMHCSNELDNYIQEQFKGALEDEKERIRRKSCWYWGFNHVYGVQGSSRQWWLSSTWLSQSGISTMQKGFRKW